MSKIVKSKTIEAVNCLDNIRHINHNILVVLVLVVLVSILIVQ